MSNWLSYTIPDEGQLYINTHCPLCGRYLKIGKVEQNGLGEFRYRDWICKKNGIVRPFVFWD